VRGESYMEVQLDLGEEEPRPGSRISRRSHCE
jgi:hypothetical protein